MLGFRGASRYAHPAYAEGFALECRAMKRVREEMGLTNVILMIPFVRRVEEAEQVLAQHGRARPRARRGRAQGLRDVRDPQQRHPDRRVRQALRRLLDRLERSDAADARRRPRLGDRRLRLRRARRRREGDDPAGGRGLRAQRDPLRPLRPGAVGLPRHGRVPGRARHRLDEPQPGHRAQDDPERSRARALLRRRARRIRRRRSA